METHIETPAQKLWSDVPPGIHNFQPDGIIWVKEKKTSARRSRILVIEFTRTYTITDAEMKEAQATKRNAYHHLITYLKGKTKETGVDVIMCPLAMSTLALIPEREWENTLRQTAIEVDRTTKIIEAGFRACIQTGHQLNNAYRSKMEDLRMQQAANKRKKGIG